jgi:methionyl-tRNA formyltransferase
MVATLDGIESGELEARDQPSYGVSRAPKITPADAQINWLQPAAAIERLIRACTPEPGAWTELAGVRIKVWPVARGADHGRGAAPLDPGELRTQRDRVLVGSATVPVELGDVQQHGKRRMPATDWARGLRLGSRPAVLG